MAELLHQYLGAAVRRSATTGSTNFSIQASNQKAGLRFVPDEDLSFSQIDVYLIKTGSPVTDLRLRIQTESGGLPSGTDVTNGDTGAFAAPGATGWSGFKNFPGTVSLTAYTPYWIVLEPINTTTLDGTNYWSLRSIPSLRGTFQGSTHNGTSWAAVTTLRMVAFMFGSSGAAVWGNPFSLNSSSQSPRVSGTTRVAAVRTLNTQKTVIGVYILLSASNVAVNDLEIKIFDSSNNLEKSLTISRLGLGITSANVSVTAMVMFAAITLPADTYYISFHQAGDGATYAY